MYFVLTVFRNNMTLYSIWNCIVQSRSTVWRGNASHTALVRTVASLLEATVTTVQTVQPAAEAEATEASGLETRVPGWLLGCLVGS